MTRHDAIQHIQAIERAAKAVHAALPAGTTCEDPRTIAKVAAAKVTARLTMQALRLSSCETDDIAGACLAAEAIADKAGVEF